MAILHFDAGTTGRDNYTQIPPTPENIRAALSHISPDISRDEWARIGMAVKDGLDGDGLDLFDEWSQGGQTYNATDCRDTWKSLRAGGGVTIGTLWRLALDTGWSPNGEGHQETEAERQAREQRNRTRAEAERQREERKRADAVLAARAIYRAAVDCEGHPYLEKKGVQPVPGLRIIDPREALAVRSFGPAIKEDSGLLLIVPMCASDGELCGLEVIDSEGRKGFMAGSSLAPFIVGTIDPGKPVAIAEGLATGISVHEATGYAAVVAFSASTLKKTAESIRAKHPEARILIAGDCGTGEAAARRAAVAVGGTVAIPTFQDRSSGVDWNDLATVAGLAEVRRQIESVLSRRNTKTPPSFSELIPSIEELDCAHLHPPCIVENYLFADLAVICAAGGTGKTTALIYESVCIALGRPLWGLKVWKPGATLFITAEDSRETIMARFREIMSAMGLNSYECSKVLSRFAVWDVSGDMVRLAELDQGGNIRLTELADSIVEAYKDDPPVIINFDPAISFGPGERMVNDGEQAIVISCRRINRGLGCCVRLIHHVGKSNARSNTLDQYSSRGGTALPDGSRMVAVLGSVNDGEHGTPPEGFALEPGDSGFVLARAKLSYAPPQPKIWIRRRGFDFSHVVESRHTKEQMDEARRKRDEDDAERICEFLIFELSSGRKHTQTSIEQIAPAALDISRSQVRAAIQRLIVCQRLVEVDLPKNERQGGRKAYLHPAGADSAGLAEKASREPRHPTPPFQPRRL